VAACRFDNPRATTLPWFGQLPDDGQTHEFEPVVWRKHLRPGFVAPKTSSDDLTWLLGVYLGDGYFDGPNRVNFAVPDTDPAVGRVREIGFAASLASS